MGWRLKRLGATVGNRGASSTSSNSPMSSVSTFLSHHVFVAVVVVAAFLSIAAEASSSDSSADSSATISMNEVEMPSVVADGGAFIESSPTSWAAASASGRNSNSIIAPKKKDAIGTKGRGDGKPRCKKLGGSIPSAKYSIPVEIIYDDMEERMERAYDRALSNCADTRIVLMGDSIVNHLRESRSCTKKIFSSYSGRGINLGMPGISSRATAMLARRVFEDTCITPEVVYLAVGINDCVTSNSSWFAAKGIIDSVKIIKGFSPDTRVVVQKVLPTSYPSRNSRGKKWEEQETYQCVQKINNRVGQWIRQHQQSCISHEDLDDVVLRRSKKFRTKVYDDGIHFWGKKGNMDPYCEAVAGAVEKYNDDSDSSENYSEVARER